MSNIKTGNTPKEVYENAKDAIYYLEVQSDISFHMPMGMEEEDAEEFNRDFQESITHLQKLLECYYDLLDHEEREGIEL